MPETLKYCDRDEYLRLLKEEAEAQSEPIDESTEDDSTLAAEIAALREELLNAVTLLKTDLKTYIQAAEETLAGVNHGDE